MRTGITINGQSVDVISSFNEMTFGQFMRLRHAKTDAETMHLLTGIDIEVCKLIPVETMDVILAPAANLGEVEHVDNPVIFGKPVPTNIGQLEYARKVNCDGLAKRYEGEEMVGRMVAIYCTEGIEDEDIEKAYLDIQDESFGHVIAAGKIISDQLNKLAESESKIPPPDYEREELRAGIKNFAKYGVWGVVRGIALRHGCKMEDVYKWSYNSVLLELKYSAEESAYQRRLSRILNPKK